MNTHLKRHLSVCACGNLEHQFVFQYYDDEEPQWQNLYLDIFLTDYSNIFKKIGTAIRYIFGHKSIYGQFDEIIITPEEAREMIAFMEEFLKTTEIKEENEDVQT